MQRLFENDKAFNALKQSSAQAQQHYIAKLKQHHVQENRYFIPSGQPQGQNEGGFKNLGKAVANFVILDGKSKTASRFQEKNTSLPGTSPGAKVKEQGISFFDQLLTQANTPLSAQERTKVYEHLSDLHRRLNESPDKLTPAEKNALAQFPKIGGQDSTLHFLQHTSLEGFIERLLAASSRYGQVLTVDSKQKQKTLEPLFQSALFTKAVLSGKSASATVSSRLPSQPGQEKLLPEKTRAVIETFAEHAPQAGQFFDALSHFLDRHDEMAVTIEHLAKLEQLLSGVNPSAQARAASSVNRPTVGTPFLPVKTLQSAQTQLARFYRKKLGQCQVLLCQVFGMKASMGQILVIGGIPARLQRFVNSQKIKAKGKGEKILCFAPHTPNAFQQDGHPLCMSR